MDATTPTGVSGIRMQAAKIAMPIKVSGVMIDSLRRRNGAHTLNCGTKKSMEKGIVGDL